MPGLQVYDTTLGSTQILLTRNRCEDLCLKSIKNNLRRNVKNETQKAQISHGQDSELSMEKEMRSGDFGVPETKAPHVRRGVRRQDSADICMHTEALALLSAQRGLSSRLHPVPCCRWNLPALSPGCWGSLLRALEDPASHILDVLGGGSLNADYWFHWSSPSPSFFPRRLLKCHWVNIADKKNDEPKNHISTWTNLLFVDLITWS